MKKPSLSIPDLCKTGAFTAVIAIMAQISIPMPFGVPMTMQTFAVSLAGILLGSKNGAIAALVYVLLGTVGLPVFAGFTGGYQYLLGPTGGFLFSFPIMAFIIGLGTELRHKWKGAFILGLILGTAVNYIVGVALFCLLTGSSVWAGLTACVIPFIPTAILKAVISSMFGLKLRQRLVVAQCN